MVDGHLNFDTKINNKGFVSGLSSLEKTADILKGTMLRLGAAITAAFSVRTITAFAKEAKSLYDTQLEAEARLGRVLKNTTGATDEQIAAVKEYSSALQDIGVISDEIQLSGLQELGTYITQTDSLKTMNKVLNDMLAQQYGLNATADNAVTISTMLGKVLDGQVSALSRYGYTFTEAQAQLLKFGTEEQKVAALAEVVEASVGGMNEALAETSAGQMKQLSNTIGDIKEEFGAVIYQIELLFLPALKALAKLLATAAQYAREMASAMGEVFGQQAKSTAATASAAEDAAESYSDMAEAAEEAAKANDRSLASFDQINKLGDSTDTSSSTAVSTDTAAGPTYVLDIDTSPAESKLSSFSAGVIKMFDQMFAPLKNALGTYGEGLISSVKGSMSSIKELFGEIGRSFAEVWNNGTGEEILGHYLVILTNIFDTVGNIAAALKTAWTTDNLGTDIVQHAADIWNTVLSHVESISQKISGWSAQLDFTPVLEALDGLEQALQPFVDTAWDGIEWLFDNVFLPLSSWTIEDALPVTLDLLSAALTVLTAAANALKEPGEWLWDKFLKPLSEWTGKIITTGIQSLTDILKNLGSWIDKHPTASAWFTGLTAAIVAFDAAASAGGLGVLVSEIGTLLTSLATVDVTVATIVAGIAGWTYAITEIADNWEAICEVIEADGGIFGFIAGWIESCTEDIEEFFDAGWFGSLWCDFWEGAGGLIHDAIDSISKWVTQPMASISTTYKGVGKWFEKRFREAHDSIVRVFSGVGSWFGDRWKDITDALSGTVSWFERIFGDAWVAMTNAFSRAGKWATDRYNDITNAFSSITVWFSNRFTQVWNAITNAFSKAGKWANDRYNDITRAFKDTAEWFSTKFKNAYTNITSAFSDIRQFFKDRCEDVQFHFKTIGGWFKDRFDAAYKNATEAFSGVKTWFTDRYREIQDIFDSVGGWFKGRFQAAYDNIVSVFAGIGGFFKGIWDGIGNGLAGSINWILDRYNDFMGKLCSIINGGIDMINSMSFDFFGMHFGPNLSHVSAPHVDHISGLASGTVVPANYGEFLAVLGDNKRETEVVSPLSTMKQAFKEALSEMSFGGSDMTANINLTLDGETVYRTVVRQNKKHVDATGENELIY